MYTNTRSHTQRERGRIYIARLSVVSGEAVFNELEAECLPLTTALEWLINQTALLSSTPLTLHSLFLSPNQLCIYYFINGWVVSRDDTWCTSLPHPLRYYSFRIILIFPEEVLQLLANVLITEKQSFKSVKIDFNTLRLAQQANHRAPCHSLIGPEHGLHYSRRMKWLLSPHLHCLFQCQLVAATEDDTQCQHCARRR